MTHVHVSNLFVLSWKKQLSIATKKLRNLTLEGIEEHVWQPTLLECQVLLEQLYTQKMDLAVVDAKFSDYNPEELTCQLKGLAKGVNTCAKLCDKNDLSWIDERVKRIRVYWDLCGYRETARTFLELRKALNLENGDFTDIEMLAKKVIN